MKQLEGRVVEVGNVECLQEEGGEERAGLLIETTREALREFAGNLAFAEVEIRLRENAEEKRIAVAGTLPHLVGDCE